MSWESVCLRDDQMAALALDILPESERHACEDHLEACGRCRDSMAETMQLQDGFAALAPEVEPPGGFAESVFLKIVGENLRPPGS
jgi:anti-sigma factor RsiW